MKKQSLLGICLIALVSLSVISCKNKTDFDAICNNLADEQLTGLHSGSFSEGSVLRVAQFKFSSDGTVERTVMAVGDGVYEAPVTTNYASYALGEYVDEGLGRTINLYPAGAGNPLALKMIHGSLIEEGQPEMSDTNDKIAEMPKTQDAILDIDWYANDTTFFKIDTTINVSVVDTFRHRERSGRTYKWVIDSIKERIVPTKMKYAVGPKNIKIRNLQLFRDPNTLKNTGSYSYLAKDYEYDAKRVGKQTLDTISEYSFSWFFESYTNAGSFVIRTLPDKKGEGESITIKYDNKVPAITIEQQVLIAKTEEEPEDSDDSDDSENTDNDENSENQE